MYQICSIKCARKLLLSSYLAECGFNAVNHLPVKKKSAGYNTTEANQIGT